MQSTNESASDKKTSNKNTHHLRYTDFQFIKLLGMGAYGKVELVSRKGIKYAMKIIQKRLLAKQGKQYQAFIQRQLLRRMNHPGIVALKTCFQDRQNLYFCLEYCEGGNFTAFLTNNQSKMTQQLRVFYLAQIVNIIEYFQSIGIVHRDLKPQNILLSEQGHLKLIDFATAQVSQCKLVDQKFKQQLAVQKKASEQGLYLPTKQLKDSIKTSEISWKSTQKSQSSSDHQQNIQSIRQQPRRRKATFVGTCYYVPPELLQKQTCCYAGDLWALGCIMYQLYYLNPPFDGASQFQVFQKIKSIDYNFPKNDKITEDAIDLIKKLLQKNPQDRIGCNLKQGLTMKDLKSHKFFTGINFDKLFEQQVPVLMDQQNKITQKQIQRLQKYGKLVLKQYQNVFENNPNILIHGAIQKRTFINYNVYYLIIFKNLKILRIKIMQPGKTRQTYIDINQKFDNKQNMPAQLLDSNFFKLLTKQKLYKFKAAQPMKWVNLINKRYKQLKQKKIQKQKLKQKNQELLSQEQQSPQQIQKQCKSISESLKLVKIELQQ